MCIVETSSKVILPLCFVQTDPLVFPNELTSHYGLTLELLSEAFRTRSDGSVSCWCLHGVPNVDFYRMLHLFLKKWSTTHSLPKSTIGKFHRQAIAR